MCLDKITKVYKPSLFNLWIPKFAYKSGVGWKWLLYFSYDNVYMPYLMNDKILPTNKFLDEKDYRCEHDMSDSVIITADKSEYNFGWHIFLERPHNPDRGNTRRVQYREGHTVGIQYKNEPNIIVAKYMKILEDCVK